VDTGVTCPYHMLLGFPRAEKGQCGEDVVSSLGSTSVHSLVLYLVLTQLDRAYLPL
jgi:hypothetical protein